MLNQKLSKAIIICLGLLPMTAVNGGNYEKDPACDAIQKENIKSKSQPERKNAKPKKSSPSRLARNSSSSTGVYFSFEDWYRSVTATTPKVRLHPRAVSFVQQYRKNNSELLQKIKKEGKIHFEMMDFVFRGYNLPVELKYLAVIESELKASAVSHVGAVGPWQLMPATARILGLKVNDRMDERRSYIKSTRAAAIYLRDLYNEFNDWLLVIAAYNAGPGPVYRAIKQTGSRNFWNLQYHLPEETRNHVKKFIGAHYFFEGEGSLTTLTRAETIAHNKAVEKELLKQSNSGKSMTKAEEKSIGVMAMAKVN